MTRRPALGEPYRLAISVAAAALGAGTVRLPLNDGVLDLVGQLLDDLGADGIGLAPHGWCYSGGRIHSEVVVASVASVASVTVVAVVAVAASIVVIASTAAVASVAAIAVVL